MPLRLSPRVTISCGAMRAAGARAERSPAASVAAVPARRRMRPPSTRARAMPARAAARPRTTIIAMITRRRTIASSGATPLRGRAAA